MADIQKGVAFSGSSPNNVVTADKLNNLVDNATILTTFLTGKSEVSAAESDDYVLIYDSSANAYKKISIANVVPSRVSRTGFSNLKADNTGATQIVVTADEIVMRSALGVPYYVSGFSATCDTTVYSGAATANGRDFTPLAAATWYYLHAISTGTTDALLFSNSRTSPSLPTGYLYWCLLGTWKTSVGVTTMNLQSQRGTECFTAWPSDGDTTNANNPQVNGVEFTRAIVNASTGVQSVVDLSRVIPPEAIKVHGVVGRASSVASADSVYRMTADASSFFSERTLYAVRDSAATIFRGFRGAISFECGVTVPSSLYIADQTSNLATKSMRISGYTLNL